MMLDIVWNTYSPGGEKTRSKINDNVGSVCACVCATLSPGAIHSKVCPIEDLLLERFHHCPCYFS